MIVYRTVSTLARDLGVPARTLYAISNNVAGHYHAVQLPRRDGSFRRLSIPDKALKHIQRAIYQHLLVYMPVSPYATAYRYGGSIFRNAAPHTGKAKVLKLDIHHFFDSILYSTVKDKIFPAELFSEPLRVLLTLLCYHQDALPQGAPTSPAISNILLRDFDETVGAWCRRWNIAYTRYCDDMTFSGDFDHQPLFDFVQRELRARGFFLNGQKTRLLCAWQRQSVTGLTVNEKVNVSATYRRALRQELYYAQRFGVESHLQAIGSSDTPERYLASLLGRVNYVLTALPKDGDRLRQRAWLLEELKSAAVSGHLSGGAAFKHAGGLGATSVPE